MGERTDLPPLAEGAHAAVPFARYLADPCPEPSASASILAALLTRSPRHAWAEHPRLGGHVRELSSRADLGTAVHAAVLGGDDRIVIVEADDWRTRAAREQRDAAWSAGQIPILTAKAGAVRAAAASVRGVLQDADLWSDDDHETTLVWREGETWCRARPDMIVQARNVVVDIKTTTNAAPQAWARSTFDVPYAVQAAWYLRGAAATMGDHGRDFIFAVVELDPPYECSLVRPSPTWIALADGLIDRALDTWRACLAADDWPGYGIKIEEAEPPPWVEMWAAKKGVQIR